MSGPATPRAWLGVDGGSSSARLCLLDDAGRVLARGESPVGTNLHVWGAATDDAVANLAAAARAVIAPHAVEVAGFVLGTAGIDAPEDRDAFAASYARIHTIEPRLPAPAVRSDIEIIGAEGAAPLRVAVIAGTGSNVLAGRYRPGEVEPFATAYVGGLDLPLTDWGSAARVGEGAIVACVRAACGLAPADSPLVHALYARFAVPWPDGWRAWKTIRARLAKPELAALARVVAASADRGDAVAVALLEGAAAELVEGIVAAVRRLEPSPGEAVEVHAVGGLLCGNPRVRGAVERGVGLALGPVTFVDADAARGAAILARRGAR